MWSPVLNPLSFPPHPQLDNLSPGWTPVTQQQCPALEQMVYPGPACCLWASQLSQTEIILTMCSSIFLVVMSMRERLSSLPLGSSTEETSGVLHNLLPRLFPSSSFPRGHIPTGKFLVCVVMLCGLRYLRPFQSATMKHTSPCLPRSLLNIDETVRVWGMGQVQALGME